MAVSILWASITFIVSGAPRNHFNRFRNLSKVAGKGSGGGRVFMSFPRASESHPRDLWAGFLSVWFLVTGCLGLVSGF